MNIITVIGRIGGPVELRTTTTGKNVASFTVAVDNPFDKENPTWFRVSCWGSQAEYANNYLDKGRLVAVSGRMDCRKYEKDGQKREAWELVAGTVQGLDRPRDDAPAETVPQDHDPFRD